MASNWRTRAAGYKTGFVLQLYSGVTSSCHLASCNYGRFKVSKRKRDGKPDSAKPDNDVLIGALSQACPDIDLAPDAQVSQLVEDAFQNVNANKDGELNANEVAEFATMIAMTSSCGGSRTVYSGIFHRFAGVLHRAQEAATTLRVKCTLPADCLTTDYYRSSHFGFLFKGAFSEFCG
ncbi:hypothetical protein BaRGS_00035200 [Batillaria attramentaria]|uniref:EF-hand domain-containing protein n=1 Tax=Batillaria attramentaria TaxID=370345 RepID=A0ABD0JF52_9CAEN